MNHILEVLSTDLILGVIVVAVIVVVGLAFYGAKRLEEN